MDPSFKDSLLKASSKEEYLKLIDEKESERFPEEEKEEVKEEKRKIKKRDIRYWL